MNNEDLLIPNKIVRSKRKSVSIIIDNNGDLVIRAPLWCKDDKICEIINNKSNWIINKRQKALEQELYPKLKFVDNEKLPIFDIPHTIRLFHQNRVKIVGQDLYLPVDDSEKKLKLFLKRTLKKYILSTIDKYLDLMNVRYTSISISSARTNWGSCSGNNKLHFTYKLAMCPIEVIDYIIVHELSHIIEKNHSARFWSIVAKYYPNYKEREKWLKSNRYIINIV